MNNSTQLSINENQQLTKRRILNILIADDDVEVGYLLKQILECRGHTVKFVDDGARCISHCLQNTYDLIFMDYHMDGLNGIDVMNIVKNEKMDKHTLIFAYTGDHSNTAIDQFRNSGMNGAIIKPIDLKSIDNLIQNLEIRPKLDTKLVQMHMRRNKELIIFA